jgi:hypothetical protein
MADINVLVGKRDALPTAGTLTTLTANTDTTIVWDGVDERMGLLISTQGTTAPTVTVKKGTGVRSVIGDLTLGLAVSKYYVVVLDSMRFKDMATGKVTIKSTQADSVALVKLP